jgi:hypothetical protein
MNKLFKQCAKDTASAFIIVMFAETSKLGYYHFFKPATATPKINPNLIPTKPEPKVLPPTQRSNP